MKSFKAFNEARFSPALIKKAIAIANSRKYKDYYSGAYRAIEKLKKGLEDDPKVLAALKAANESIDEGMDREVKAIAKNFKKLIQDIRRGYMDITDKGAKKLYAAVHGYLMNNEPGDWDDVDFADEKISDFIHDMKGPLGKV